MRYLAFLFLFLTMQLRTRFLLSLCIQIISPKIHVYQVFSDFQNHSAEEKDRGAIDTEWMWVLNGVDILPPSPHAYN